MGPATEASRTDANGSTGSASATLALLMGRLELLNGDLIARLCARHDVSPAEFRTLAMLAHRVPTDPVRPTEIRRWVLQTSGGTTATLNRLERTGRIERVPDPSDGRSVRVDLTSEGRAFYEGVLDEIAEAYEMVLAPLGTERALNSVRPLIAALEVAGQHERTSQWSVERP